MVLRLHHKYRLCFVAFEPNLNTTHLRALNGAHTVRTFVFFLFHNFLILERQIVTGLLRFRIAFLVGHSVRVVYFVFHFQCHILQVG